MSQALITQNVNPAYYPYLRASVAAGLESSKEYILPPLVALIADYAMSHFVRDPRLTDYDLVDRGQWDPGPGDNTLIMPDRSYKLCSNSKAAAECPRMRMAHTHQIYFCSLFPDLRNDRFALKGPFRVPNDDRPQPHTLFIAPRVHGDYTRYFEVLSDTTICDPNDDRVLKQPRDQTTVHSVALDPNGQYLFLGVMEELSTGTVWLGIQYSLPNFEQVGMVMKSGLDIAITRGVEITANDSIVAFSSFSDSYLETQIWDYRTGMRITTFSGYVPTVRGTAIRRIVLGDHEMAVIDNEYSNVILFRF